MEQLGQANTWLSLVGSLAWVRVCAEDSTSALSWGRCRLYEDDWKAIATPYPHRRLPPSFALTPFVAEGDFRLLILLSLPPTY